MSLTQVTPELMRTTAKQIEAKIGEWNAAVEKIYALAQQMDAMWDGLGNDSFNIIFQQDRPKFQNLTMLMNEYAQAITTAATLYDTGEQEVKNIVTRRR